ncbi:MAG: response regulator [Leptonema illini]|uniref:histidine kinase n=1 Tax=Leptonema illini TaxID=183 RepID=A0A833M347_9LEPT|nr:MAG: response regulator [Leptonema illini]
MTVRVLWKNPVVVFVGVAVAYAVTGRLGLQLSFVNSNVTLVWPPTGIATAALLLFGIRYWPAVFAGALIVNLWNGNQAAVAASIAVGNTAAIVVAWYFLGHRFRIHHDLSRVRDVMAILFWGGSIAPIISACWGTATLVFSGIAPAEAALSIALVWWVGDGMGILLLLPLLLVYSQRPSQRLDWRRLIEWVLSLAILAAVGDVVFIGPFGQLSGYPLIYLLFPFMIWLSVRFGSRGASVALFLTAVFSVWSTLRGFGPFQREDVHESLIFLHTYLFFTALSTLLLGAVIEEKRRIMHQLMQERMRSEEASRLKSEFLANMSHEIRTPMSAILGYADLLESDSLEPSIKRSYVRTIRRNGEHLLQILDDILDISRIESGRLTVEPVDIFLSEMMNEMAELFSMRAEQKGLAFHVSVDPGAPVVIKSDPLRLRQILVNLIGNAIKFTEHGYVSVAMSSTEMHDCCELRFTIRDTGPGISGPERERLFQPFVQGNSTVSRSFGGTGLGLAISSRLAAALGGHIDLESEPGRGSTFTVQLRIPAAHCIHEITEATDVRSSKESGRESLRVLLAEDSPDLQILIRHMLESTGCTVELASNGQEAVIAAQAAPFDIIFMDVQMPVMDGLRATQELRRSGYAGPVVALTAHAMTEERNRCLAAGMNEHISKPVRRQALIDVIGRFTVSASDSR